ncbi:helix-turn-helix domain-containing protein [Lentilitoribacter sp. EG35]|uniref:helix-turn-helix domain-containing protein n=1 Tax=Lentilitoribacter sp. EG35 TaxID=3234192 RepID=UPI0034603095
MVMATQIVKDRIQKRMIDLDMKIPDLARASGVQDATIRKYLKQTGTTIGLDKAEKIATALGFSLADLSEDQSAADTVGDISSMSLGSKRIPIIGSAGASFASGKIIVEKQPIGATFSPPALLQARDIYAFYISGSSMAPEHNDGEIRFASPHIPCRIRDTAAVHEEGDDGKVYLSVGHLVEIGTDKVTIAKIHPTPANIEIPNDRIKSIDKVLTQNDLFGA